MPKHKKYLFLLVVMIPLLVSGCWDKKEINQIGFAVGLGIDKDGSDYQITTQMALPVLLEGGGGGEEPPVWVVSGKGKTIFEAIRDVNTRSARKPFWGHLNVIVFGEEVAKDGLIPVLDLLSRGKELRRSNYVVVAQGKARDILEAQPKLESINAVFISELIENRTGQSVAPAVTINDLLLTLSSAGKENVLPRIRALEQESFLPPVKEKEDSKEKEEKPKEILELRGSGVFKGDKLIGWLDEETTRGYLWVRGEVKGGVIVVENPVEPNSFISLEIKSNKSKIIPRIGKENIIIDINISTSLNLVENAGSINVEDKNTIQNLQQRAGDAINKEIQKAIIKARETKSDFLGMGEVGKAVYPKVWEGMDWSEALPTVDINIEVQVDIEEAAMTLKPVMLPSQRAK